jgi:hypothetical protein
VRLHRRHDHDLGQREQALVEATLEHRRLLDHVDDLLQFPGRVAPLAERIQTGDDRAATPLRVRLDTRGPQRLGIGVRMRDLDLAVGEAAAVRAVSFQRLVVEEH